MIGLDQLEFGNSLPIMNCIEDHKNKKELRIIESIVEGLTQNKKQPHKQPHTRGPNDKN